ncbi:MAG: MerC domain-containing protein [Flavobacteriales bacterium]|jgi:hypothetical protein|nr:MerC domain-containing protein [Flavobacteriales bacterium]
MLLTRKSDVLGAFFSTLCIVHCTITPFLFVAQTCTATCCESSPEWWQYLDYAFIIISFFAVATSVKYTTKKWMIYAFWASWIAFVLVIINSSVGGYSIPSVLKHVPSAMLIGLHLYNKKYCSCEDGVCVQSENK